MPLFVATVYQSWGGASNRDNWVNTWEVETDTELGAPEWAAYARKLLDCQAMLQLSQVFYNRVVVRTNEPEAPAQSANSFRSIPFALTGSVATGQLQAYDLNMGLIVSRGGGLGRLGRLVIRGAIHEGIVMPGPGGAAVLTPEAVQGWQQINVDWTAVLNAIPGFQVVRIREIKTVGSTQVTQIVSPVNNYSVAGLSIVKRNHKWFNRAAAA